MNLRQNYIGVYMFWCVCVMPRTFLLLYIYTPIGLGTFAPKHYCITQQGNQPASQQKLTSQPATFASQPVRQSASQAPGKPATQPTSQAASQQASQQTSQAARQPARQAGRQAGRQPARANKSANRPVSLLTIPMILVRAADCGSCVYIAPSQQPGPASWATGQPANQLATPAR